MKPRGLVGVLLHRHEALCRALVGPLLSDRDGLEMAGGYNGWGRLIRTQRVYEWSGRSSPAETVWLLERLVEEDEGRLF